VLRLKQALKSAIHYGDFHMTAQYYEAVAELPKTIAYNYSYR
jgi:hypothetical protein